MKNRKEISSPKKINDLLMLYKQELEAMKAVRCGLKHEEVKVSGAGVPIRMGHPEGEGHAYERLGFCKPELRKKRIGCAHTTVRYAMREALNLLSEIGDASLRDYYTDLHNQLNYWEDQVHKLDILKGEMDKSLAMLLERENVDYPLLCDDGLEAIKENIRAIVKDHNRCVDAIESIRKKIVKNINRLQSPL